MYYKALKYFCLSISMILDNWNPLDKRINLPFFACRYISIPLQQMNCENIVLKGEIAHYENSSLSHNVFKLLYFPHICLDVFKRLLLLFCCMWERVKTKTRKTKKSLSMSETLKTCFDDCI